MISYLPPQIADGGGSAQKWTTSFTFSNPHSTFTANATLYFYDNNGQPLKLDVGNGPVSQFNFTLGPLNTVTFVSASASSPTVQTGWAIAASSLPAPKRGAVSLFREWFSAAGRFRSRHCGLDAILFASYRRERRCVYAESLERRNGRQYRRTRSARRDLATVQHNLERSEPYFRPTSIRSFHLYRPASAALLQIGAATPTQPALVALILSGDGGVLSRLSGGRL